MMTRRCALAALLLFGCFGVQAQTIFVARHAERTGEPDPPLNADGQKRAGALARLLSDAGVSYFYASDTVRAQQTAEPTAKQEGRTIEVYAAKEVDKLVSHVLETATPEKATLIIGHRSTVPLIVKALGGGEISELRSDEHDRLIIVTRMPDGKTSTVTLRYGE